MCDLEDFGPDSLQKRQATPSCVVYGKRVVLEPKQEFQKQISLLRSILEKGYWSSLLQID